MATIDGNPVLGGATTVVMVSNPNAQQINQYYGVNGEQTLFGGTRGRILFITGVLYADTIGDLNALEQSLLSYCDGNAHVVIDDRGREFDNVVFTGEGYQPDPTGVHVLAGGGWCLPYKFMGRGLI